MGSQSHQGRLLNSVELLTGITGWSPSRTSSAVGWKNPPAIWAVIMVVVHIALAELLLRCSRVVRGDSGHFLGTSNRSKQMYETTPKSMPLRGANWAIRLLNLMLIPNVELVAPGHSENFGPRRAAAAQS